MANQDNDEFLQGIEDNLQGIEEPEADGDMEARIKHLLELYPVISPTMLQAGLGPQIPPAKWRPALEKLLDSGEVRQESVYRQSVAGRHRNYIRLGLSVNMDAMANS